MSSKSSGTAGEETVRQLLEYEGWSLERQVHIGAVTIDFVGTHAVHPETLFEVKVWADPKSGRDTVKKALADAYYLQAVDEERPYVLVLSHQLTQGYRDMITAAIKAGAISQVRIIGFTEFVVTPDELDYLAVAQEEIRQIFAAAQARVAAWEPAPFASSPPSGPAAATSGGGDEAA